MRNAERRRGVTLAEMMVAMAILGIISIAFAGFLKYALRTAVVENTQAQGQEAVRQGLELAEAALIHANEITIASSTLVEFIADADQSPFWNRNALDCGGVPYWRSTDVDCDAATLAIPADAWKSGFNLTDDDDDGDGNVDVRERIYLQNGALYRDMSLNGAAWGGRVVKLLPNVSTFTLTYWGSKGNQLGAAIDTNADGAISQSEMDCAAGGGGNCDGSLDLQIELSYITSVRLSVGVDGNKDGTTEYKVDTDVYPPLLPLKPLQ
jgi:prepilin-type N-terminal cleavage/methylation domain-containing protein